MRHCGAILILLLSGIVFQSCSSRRVALDPCAEGCGVPCKPKYCCVWQCEMMDCVYKKKRCYRVPQPYQKCICRYEPIYDEDGCCVSWEPKFITETRYRLVPVYYFTNEYDRSPHYFREVYQTCD